MFGKVMPDESVWTLGESEMIVVGLFYSLLVVFLTSFLFLSFSLLILFDLFVCLFLVMRLHAHLLGFFFTCSSFA